MDRDHYHHGALKKELISKGLLLLNREGYEGLSLRKVAVMCGVSHSAPYKHFRSKEELISAIVHEVTGSFNTALNNALLLHPDNPPMQIVELGRQYVKFMVENPEYLKFLFLSDNDCPIIIENNEFHFEGNVNFEIVKKSVENYLKAIDYRSGDAIISTLSMWSLVHGITVLIVNKSIIYDGDYLGLVTKMIIETFHIKL